MKTFTFDGVPSTTWGLRVGGNRTFGSSKREYEQIQIDGRSGDLTLDKGRYSNVSVTYNCGITDSMLTNYDAMRGFLMSHTGYKRLEDDFQPDYYRMAMFAGDLNPDIRQYYRSATMDVTFNCMPQLWLKSGETEINNPATLVNPTNFEAKPLLRVYGAGTVTIGASVLTISAHSYSYIDIDCETMDCFYGATNCNAYVSGNFPVLGTGTTGISFTVTQLKVTPRWYTL